MRKFLVLILAPIIFEGCRKPTGANWDVDVVLPIVNSSMNIKSFAGDTLFAADSTGLLHFVYNRQIAAIMLDSLMKLPDTSIVKSFPEVPLPFSYTLMPGQQFPNSAPVDLEFDIGNGIELTRIDVRAAILNIKFSNTASQPVDLVYQLPGSNKSGLPFTITETIPPGNNSLVKSYDLSGYSIKLRGSSGKDFNTIGQTYSLSVSPSADTLVLQPGQGAKIDLTYSEMIPQYVEGYFGQETITLDVDTTRIDLVEEFRPTNFMLSDATMTFRVVNEFGADFRASISNIKSINSHANNTISLSTNKLSAINIDRATNLNGYPEPKTWTTTFTSANSNIVPFISNLPDKLTYQGMVAINPAPIGNTGYRDFAYYKTGLRIFADIDIPLRFRAGDFRLESVAAADFTNVEQLNNVNSGNFIIKATNGFPFAAKMQAYMMDVNNVVIDSMFVNGSNIITGGALNSLNEVITPAVAQLMIPIDAAKIASLKKCKSVKVVSVFIMPPTPPDIPLKENYSIDVNIIAELNYHVGIISRK